MKSGKYFLTKKPYLEGYQILESDVRTIKIEIKDGKVYGTNKFTGELQSFPIHELAEHKCYIDVDEKVVIRKKLRDLTKMRHTISSYFDSVLTDIDTTLTQGKYFEIVNQYPEVLV